MYGYFLEQKNVKNIIQLSNNSIYYSIIDAEYCSFHQI